MNRNFDDQKNISDISTFKHVILLDQVPRQNSQFLPCKILMNLSKLCWSQIWKIFFYSKSYKTKNWKKSVPEARNQSCKHINASTFFGVNRLLKSNIILLPILKADSDVTVDAGTTKTSRAIWERLGYSTELLFHQASMRKSGILNWVTQLKWSSLRSFWKQGWGWRQTFESLHSQQWIVVAHEGRSSGITRS